MRDAAIEAVLPEHVISWIETPALEISDVLMKKVDLIMDTGGSSMVHAAYSSETGSAAVQKNWGIHEYAESSPKGLFQSRIHAYGPAGAE